MESKLDPAATIIEMCGGIDRVAAIVGLNRSTVYRWTQPDGPRGGTGGAVPLRHAVALMTARPALTPAHFFANFGKPQNPAHFFANFGSEKLDAMTDALRDHD